MHSTTSLRSQQKNNLSPLSLRRPVVRTTLLFMTLGLIFTAFGVLTCVRTSLLREVVIEKYSSTCSETLQTGTSCSIQFVVPQRLEAPISVYYQLVDFHPTFRMYTQSKSRMQTAGDTIDWNQAQTTCSPYATNLEMGKTLAADGVTSLSPSAVAYPCGAIAYHYFNDTFQLYDPSLNPLPIDQTLLAPLYTGLNNAALSKQWMSLQDQHFKQWMLTAQVSQMRKLWGRIKTTSLEKGVHTIVINNNYNISRWGGSKNIILTETYRLGYRSFFIPGSLLAAGVLLLTLSGFFISNHVLRNRRMAQSLASQKK